MTVSVNGYIAGLFTPNLKIREGDVNSYILENLLGGTRKYLDAAGYYIAHGDAVYWYDSTAVLRSRLTTNATDDFLINCLAGKALLLAYGVAGHVDLSLFGGARADGLDQENILAIDAPIPTAVTTLKHSPIVMLRAATWNAGWLETDDITFRQWVEAITAGADAAQQGTYHMLFGPHDAESAMIDFVMTTGPAYKINILQKADMGATNLLLFNGYGIKEYAGYAGLQLRNAADNAYATLVLSTLNVNDSIDFIANAKYMAPPNGDDNYFVIKARDNGVGLIEVARVAGAADPYFAMGGSQQNKFYNSGLVDLVPPTGSAVNVGVSCNFKRFYSEITLDTIDAETAVGLTPSAVILSAAIRVSVQITGLDSADHHIQLGINGNASKYIDVAQGAAATTIDVNKKGNYKFDPTTDTEAAALVLTITGGADQIPTAGKVYVEVIYLDSTSLADA